MNRRTMLKAGLATLAAFVLPAPRKRIDLMRFCDTAACRLHRYDMRLPYCLDDWTYATDSRICVRVRPETADVFQHKGEVPPFSSLDWNYDQIRGWRPLPDVQPIVGDNAKCPGCDGCGHTPAETPQECETCGGTGHEWIGKGWHPSVPVRCKACRGRGHLIPPGCKTCDLCDGAGWGLFPAYAMLDGRYFDLQLYEKLKGLGGAEYTVVEFLPDTPLLKFRFDGGDGLLVGLDDKTAKENAR